MVAVGEGLRLWWWVIEAVLGERCVSSCAFENVNERGRSELFKEEGKWL
jgi:hypothetical protein